MNMAIVPTIKLHEMATDTTPDPEKIPPARPKEGDLVMQVQRWARQRKVAIQFAPHGQPIHTYIHPAATSKHTAEQRDMKARRARREAKSAGRVNRKPVVIPIDSATIQDSDGGPTMQLKGGYIQVAPK